MFLSVDQESNINQCLLFMLIFLFPSFRVQNLYPLFSFLCQETIFLSYSISSSVIYLSGHICDVDQFILFVPLSSWYAPCKVLLMGSVHAGITNHEGRVSASKSLIFY